MTRIVGEWDDLVDTLAGGAFDQRMDRALRIAGRRSAASFQRHARAMIRAKVYAPNSPITVAIKGSSTPLVDRGDLFQALTGEVGSDPTEVRLGIVRKRAGAETVNIAAILHEGATVDLSAHPNVRRAMFARLRESTTPDRMARLRPRQRTAVATASARITSRQRTGSTPMTDRQRRAWFGRMKREGRLVRTGSLGSGGGILRIPARPFIVRPATSSAFREDVLDHYEEAIAAGFGGRA